MYMLFGIIFVLGIIFTLFIYFNLVPLNTRYIFLIILNIGVIVSIYTNHLDINLFRITNAISIILYGLLTLSCYVYITYTKLNSKKLFSDNDSKYWINSNIFYLCFSVPLQELLTRVYLLSIFKYYKWDNFIVFMIFSAATFSFSHVFIKNIRLLLMTFLIGLFWSGIYYYYPDFIPLCISHYIVGWTITKSKFMTKKKINWSQSMISP